MTRETIAEHGGRRHPAAVFAGRLLRVVVAAGLFWLALRQADVGQIAQAVGRASVAWLAAAVGLVLADRTLMAVRWLVLLRAIEPGMRLPLSAILRVFFVSTFAGSALPGSVGGDALRVLGLSRLGVPTRDAVGSVAVDRLLGTISMLLMSVVGLLLLGRLADSRLLVLAIGLTAVVAAAALLLLFDSRLLSGLVDAAAGSRLPTVQRLGQKFLAAVRQYGTHRRTLAVVLATSLVVQVLRILQGWCLGLALGLAVEGLWYFAFVPVIVLVILLPISVGGLGTGNLAFVELFALAGVGAAEAFVLSVLFLALGLVGNLPGGLLVALDRDLFRRKP